MRLRTIIAILLTLPFLGFLGVRMLANIYFTRECGGHLARAASANTVETAIEELELSLRYLENTKRTEGYTSILYQTPAEDIGFWYRNLRQASQELQELPATTSALERSNMLMKLGMSRRTEAAVFAVKAGVGRTPTT